jgi:hypothetical protein
MRGLAYPDKDTYFLKGGARRMDGQLWMHYKAVCVTSAMGWRYVAMQILLAALVLFALVPVDQSYAQDLEPRAFSPAPVGMNFFQIGYGYADGNVFFDQSLPAEDVTGKMHSAVAGYLRTLGIFGATAKLGVVVPYVWGDWNGLWLDQPASASRRGIADPLVSVAVNFIGAPARTLRELGTYREGTVVGASVLASVPIGQYDPEKLLNLGSNRWGFRGRLGLSQRVKRWNFEVMGELWAFTKNPEAFGGVSITQDPILAIQLNAIYQFKRGFWAGVGFGYGEGGQTTVSGVEKDTRQTNNRFGATLVYPINKHNSLKLTYLNSVSTVIGADFDKLGLYWQVRWGGGL